MQLSQKIDGFRQKDTQLLELIQFFKQTTLEKFFDFHLLPNLYIGFKDIVIANTF